MTTTAAPRWRQGFDAAERLLAPRLESLVRSEPFAITLGLAARLQRTARNEMARSTRRWLHLWNMPAGTDVTRILGEIGRLANNVRDLSMRLEAMEGFGRDDVAA